MVDFSVLKNGDKLADNIDKEVSEFRIFEGKKYLCSKRSMYQIGQFDPANFVMYNGNKEAGDKLDENELKTLF